MDVRPLTAPDAGAARSAKPDRVEERLDEQVEILALAGLPGHD
jgi:hypothetical protein